VVGGGGLGVVEGVGLGVAGGGGGVEGGGVVGGGDAVDPEEGNWTEVEIGTNAASILE
jgi:hypothetical protein